MIDGERPPRERAAKTSDDPLTPAQVAVQEPDDAEGPASDSDSGPAFATSKQAHHNPCGTRAHQRDVVADTSMTGVIPRLRKCQRIDVHAPGASDRSDAAEMRDSPRRDS